MSSTASGNPLPRPPSRKPRAKAESDQAGAPLARGAGRPPVKRNEIFDAIRQEIVSGNFPPGGRIWTLREIGRKFDASPVTVQAVLQDLTQAGFIYSQGAKGTFVHESPPFLHRYAVVCFDHGPLEEVYFMAIRQETLRLQREGWSIDLIDLPREPLRSDGVFDLENRVARRLYQGLIFSQAPDHLLGTAILDTPEVKLLSLTRRIGLHQNMHAISPAQVETWLERALGKVVETGKKRVGLFLHSPGRPQLSEFADRVPKFGLETHRTWTHAIHHEGSDEASRIIELIFSLPVAKRPDVLLVADDNLIGGISRTLKECGIQIPLISHCNYPLLPEVHLPVTWLGYDIRDLLLKSIQLLESKPWSTDSPPEIVALLPRFEKET